jgi:hypothetical protein
MLTSSQYQTLKTFLENNAPYNAIQNDEDGDFAIRDLLNQIASPVFKVWNTETLVTEIVNAVLWDRYTPNSSNYPIPSAEPDLTVWRSRLQLSQTKRDNLWALLDVTNGFVNASKANIRLALQDAVISIPTGVAGAAVSAGGSSGANVLNACTRDAKVIEQVLNVGNQTTGTVTAAIMGYVGDITKEDVGISRRSI